MQIISQFKSLFILFHQNNIFQEIQESSNPFVLKELRVTLTGKDQDEILIITK